MAEADRPITEAGERVILADASLSGFPEGTPGKEAAPRRGKGTALLFSVPLALVAIGGYFYLTSGETVSTNNAYVKQNIVSVSSDVAGRIMAVNVRENQMVKAGDILFQVDPEPYKVALAQADAAIASAQVKVTELQTDYSTSGVSVAGAQSDVTFTRSELQRQQELMNRGFTTRAKLQAAQNAFQNASLRVQLAQVDAQKAKAALATGAQVPGENPAIAAARAQRAKAQLDLTRTTVRAPVSGRISQADRLQVGQMMMTGLPAVSIVASDRSWIEANFKETNLARMYPGQPATVRLDAYPDTELHGHVESIGAGTGSEFSVLPAQNATGNWVKVTQRIPVRIVIDQKSRRQMIAGQSADVTVDIGKAAK
jgi:membrane fusion protein (multidrug efflux system)